MTPTRRIIRARTAELAKRLPRAKYILEIGIAGDDPPGANREFFVPAEGGVYATADRNEALKPDYVLDIEKDIEGVEYLKHRFDLVICSQVLEHVWDLKAATKSLWLLTAWGGMCLVDLPFLYPPHGSEQEPDYWRLTPQGLDRLLCSAGFQRVELWTDPAWLVVQATAQKGLRT